MNRRSPTDHCRNLRPACARLETGRTRGMDARVLLCMSTMTHRRTAVAATPRFSLVELLFVIGIVALLLAIFLPY